MGNRLATHAVLVMLTALVASATARAGAVFISGDDADDDSHCQATRCGALYPTALRLLYAQCDPVPDDREGILAIGVNGNPALSSLMSWVSLDNGGPGAPVTVITDLTEIANVVFENYRVVYLPSSWNTPQPNAPNTVGGITPEQIAAFDARAADLQTYINVNNGRLLSLTEAGAAGAYGWLPAPLTFINATGAGGGDSDIDPLPEMDTQFPGTQANPTNMDHCCYHTIWTGPAGYSGLKVLAVSRQTTIPDPADPTRTIPGPVIVGGCNVKITSTVCDDTNHSNPDCWICGNGWPDPGEECDDGNLQNGDGCESDCKLPIGNPCAGTPAAMYPLKGVKAGVEAHWEWIPQLDSQDGYRVYSVPVKNDLDASVSGKGARGSNPGATKECETADGTGTGCVDPDALAPGSPPRLFMQVVGICGSNEGLN